MATMTRLLLLRHRSLISSVVAYGVRNPPTSFLRSTEFLSPLPQRPLLPCPCISLSPARSFCAQAQEEEMAEINAKFAEAREEIELAMESKETVYFNDEAESARVAVKAVLEKYQALLDRLPEDQRGAVQRSMGLKMEQLKAEFNQLNE